MACPGRQGGRLCGRQPAFYRSAAPHEGNGHPTGQGEHHRPGYRGGLRLRGKDAHGLARDAGWRAGRPGRGRCAELPPEPGRAPFQGRPGAFAGFPACCRRGPGLGGGGARVQLDGVPLQVPVHPPQRDLVGHEGHRAGPERCAVAVPAPLGQPQPRSAHVPKPRDAHHGWRA